MIPKIIHQIWFKFGDGPSTPPEKYQVMKKTWRDLHPDWTFMEWDLEKSRTFLKSHYPGYLDMFDGYIKDIFKVDAIRYFLLHHYGGFYVDSDCTCIRNIENLRKYKTVLCVDKYIKRVNNNHFMGSVPDNQFFKECYLKLPFTQHFQLKDSYVSTMSVAGPFFLHTMRISYKRKNEIYVMSLDEERKFLFHNENHSWNVNRNLTADITRAVIAGGALILAGSYINKKL